jgi:hypothetical protein
MASRMRRPSASLRSENTPESSGSNGEGLASEPVAMTSPS